MSKVLEEINGVEYWVREVLLGQPVNGKVRLVVPETVDGLPLEGFVLLSHAKSESEPERELVFTLMACGVYEHLVPRYLLRGRSFHLGLLSFSVNSPLANLRKSFDPELCQNPTINNLLRLIKWGKSSEPTTRLLHKALYRHPEWLPLAQPKEDLEKLLEQLFDDLASEFSERIIESTDSVEDYLKGFLDRYLVTFLYWMERQFVFIYGKGMKRIYDRLKCALTPVEKTLFRYYFLPDPAYLNRIRALDISPVYEGYQRMQQQILQALSPEEFCRITPDMWDVIWPAYLSFYPHYEAYLREAEKDRERKTRKTDRSDLVEDFDALKIEAGEQPMYSANPQLQALLNLGRRWDDSPKKSPAVKTSKKPKKEKTRMGTPAPSLTFLSPNEKMAIVLTNQGRTQKEISEQLGFASRSAISKIVHKTQARMMQSWDRVYQREWERYRRTVKDDLRKVPKEHRAVFSRMIKELFKTLFGNVKNQKGPNRKDFEKDLLGPWETK